MKTKPKSYLSLSGQAFPTESDALIDSGYYEHAEKLAALSGPWGYGVGEVVVLALYRLLKKGEIE